MTRNNTIYDELFSLSPRVAVIPRVNVFTVPDNYFNTLTAKVTERAHTESSAVLSGLSKHPLTVPEGYFSGLAANILQKIRQPEGSVAEELKNLSPALSAIGNANVYTVPKDYFEQLSVPSFEAPAKVVEMKKRTGFIRYMAAAAITGIIGLTVINIADKQPGSTAPVAISEQVMAEANNIIKNKSFDAELNTISDADIEKYLTDNGQNVNAALVASATDEVNLPSALDYIVDDNTLDNFLNKMNLNN